MPLQDVPTVLNHAKQPVNGQAYHPPSDVSREFQLARERGENMLRTFLAKRSAQRLVGRSTLYHFAPKLGLCGMIEKSRMRASNAVEIKDGKEILPGIEALTEILDTESSVWTCSNESRELLSQMMQEWGQGIYPVRTYVVCFCTEPDVPLLWQRFGADGYGYMLEFKADLYIPHSSGEQPTYLTSPVLYDGDVQRRRLEEALNYGCQMLHAVEGELGHQLSGTALRLFHIWQLNLACGLW